MMPFPITPAFSLPLTLEGVTIDKIRTDLVIDGKGLQPGWELSVAVAGPSAHWQHHRCAVRGAGQDWILELR